MATTTNYGWTTPDDTALVKDGASAIRTLGSSVDTTTKNLNPETTLADIAYRSSTANVNTRLGIGTTGQVLTVAGGVPSWATPSSGGMTLLSTTALSSTATTITGISQAHTNLVIFIPTVTFSASADFSFKTGDTSLSTNYFFLRQRTSVSTFNSGAARINCDMSQTVFDGIYITINRYSDASRHGGNALVMKGLTGDVSNMDWYDYTTTTGISQIQISSVAGTATMSAGSVYIYGVK